LKSASIRRGDKNHTGYIKQRIICQLNGEKKVQRCIEKRVRRREERGKSEDSGSSDLTARGLGQGEYEWEMRVKKD